MKNIVKYTEIKNRTIRNLNLIMIEAHKQGFNVYVTTYGFISNYNYFFTEFNGKWGYIQNHRFGGYCLSMPIKPSRKYGSNLALSLMVDGLGDSFNKTVEKLHLLKNEFNVNNIIGKQKNYPQKLENKSLVEFDI